MVPRKRATETRFLDALGSCLQIGLPSIRAVGPAAETLAAIISITNRETFVRQSEIANHARLPLATVKKHIAKLQPDWIVNKGRQPTRSGWVRRTTTISPTTMALGQRSEYLLLPWWCRCSIANLQQLDGKPRSNRLSWSEKVVFGVVVSQVVKIQRGDAAAREVDDDSVGVEVFNRDRYSFSLTQLATMTGLSRKSIVAAKHSLFRIRLIDWAGDVGMRDCIAPNFGLKICEEPSEKPGYCYISLLPK